MPPSERFPAWRVLKRQEILAIPGRLSVATEAVELPDGRQVDDYLQVKIPAFVLVFAETVDGEVLCLRQYRHGLRDVSLEFVAGRIDGDEPPIEAARRELLEETGYVSDEWQSLGCLVASSTQGLQDAYIFRARNAVQTQPALSGDLEDASVELLRRDQLKAAMVGGEIRVAVILAAMALVML
jgi:ADP-ribose pyrophosphatase